MSWDPTQYLKFAGERLRPAIDLLDRVPLVAEPQSDLGAEITVVDLGCGAGTLTPLIQLRWPQAKHIGVDASATMLAKAQQDYPPQPSSKPISPPGGRPSPSICCTQTPRCTG